MPADGHRLHPGDHEDAPGQIELNWTFDHVERTADRLTTYRQICAQVAREFDVIACFMTKPFMGLSANGCHHNFSLWQGGGTTVKRLGEGGEAAMPGVFSYNTGGDNVFEPEGDDPRMPGRIGQWVAGGIVKHLPALTALGASTVNSYRRLLDLGYWAPVYNNWGYQNRTCALRVSAPGRFEYRAVDSMVNPYLLSAALLAVMDEGISEQLDPGPLEQRNIYELELAGEKVVKLPNNPASCCASGSICCSRANGRPDSCRTRSIGRKDATRPSARASSAMPGRQIVMSPVWCCSRRSGAPARGSALGRAPV